MLAILISRNTGSQFSEMLAIIFVRHAGDKCSNIFFRKWRRMLTNMISKDISNYKFQKYWRQMLAIIISRNAGDEC